MKLISVELVGYKRLYSLNKIDRIKITPESKIQLILGRNGSGKSSIIKEITPLPGLSSAFRKGGSKIIEYHHKNSHYLLKNYFHETGNRYHFIKDGVERLKSNTSVTAYRDMVQTEFGMTQEIHDLMTCLTRFTSMESGKRRSWLTRFSDIDYTFAISYYGRLKDKLKGTKEALKLFEARLVQESGKLLKPEEEKRYRDDICVLNECLNFYLENKTPVNKGYHDVVQDVKKIDEILTTLHRSYLTQRKNFYKENVELTSQEHLDSDIISVQANIQSYQHRIDILCEQIEDHQRTVESLRSSNVTSFTEIDKTLDSIDGEIALKKQQLFYPEVVWVHPDNAASVLKNVYIDLTAAFSELPVNESKHFSREGFEKTTQELNVIKSQISESIARSNDITSKLKEMEHLKTHDKLECPKCSHVWFNGYDEKKVINLTQDLAKQTKVQESGETVSKFLESYLSDAREYFEKYRYIKTIMNATETELQPLWDVIMNGTEIFTNPRLLTSKIERLAKDLQIYIELKELFKKQKEAFDLKILLSKNQDLNLSKLQQDLAKNDQLLYQTTLEQSRFKEKLLKLNNCKTSIRKMDELQSEMKRLIENRDLSTGKLDDLLKRDILNEYINITRRELAEREQVISRINIQKALVDDITKQVDELAVKVKVISMAVTELSPTEGLIAKGLVGFINHFVMQMNNFIKKAWMYPMELMPIEASEEDGVDLDYKFRVKINDNQDDDEKDPDISLCSSGQKEIIDLAFVVVSMQYLGLGDSAIFLDEFGARFDIQHRASVSHFVTNLMITTNFSQIFMISHFEGTYASLANTDITVLCDIDFGLSKDTVFNRYTIIE